MLVRSTLTIDDPRHPEHPKGCTESCCVVQRKPDSDEEGEEELIRQLTAKRQRLQSSTVAPRVPPMGSTELVLTYSFPESRGLEANSCIVKVFKQCEKFEIACQGDDHGDPELRATNSEALLYSRAAAVVAGQESCLRATRQRMGEKRFLVWLATLPFIGANRAKQCSEILTSGTCEALESFRTGAAPIAMTANARRIENGAGRSMAKAPAKLELSKVVAISRHLPPSPAISGHLRPSPAISRHHGASWLRAAASAIAAVGLQARVAVRRPHARRGSDDGGASVPSSPPGSAQAATQLRCHGRHL